MTLLNSFLGNLSLGFSVVIAVLGATEKLRTVIERRAKWHPVMVSWLALRKHATALMISAVVVELAIAALLFSGHGTGWVVLTWITLVGVYSFLGYRSVAKSGECGCFGAAFEMRTTRGFLLRNLVILIAAGLMFSYDSSGGFGTVMLGMFAIAVAALCLRINRWIRQAHSNRYAPRVAERKGITNVSV